MSRPRGRRTALVWLLVGLILCALAGGLAFYHPLAPSKAQAAIAPPQVDPKELGPAPPPLPVKRTTFLVMGVDQRGEDTGRADTMMVVSYDPSKQDLAMLSLPRDTWVQIPGHGYDKINHSYAYGGEQLAVATAQKLLGIPIDHFVAITFQGFERIVDALGGIDIDSEKRMEYHDPSDVSMGPDGLLIDIQPGPQHMDGLTALKYARYRMDDEGDVGRMRRQQQVLRAAMKAAATPAVIAKIPQLVTALADTVDTDLSVAEMIRLGVGGKEAVTKPLKTGTLSGSSRPISGIFYIIPDLVTARRTAYEILVGASPPEAFMKRAAEDQTAYQQALAEVDDGSVVADAGDGVTASTDGGTPSQPGDTGTPGTAPGTTRPGTTQPTQPGTTIPGTTKPATPPTTKPPANKLITVAVVDASGARLGQEYANKLRAAGFRVARVSKVTQTVQRTVVIDHAGQTGTEKRLRAVFPNLLWVSSPDSKAEEAVEIVLGQDLAPKPKTP